MMKSIVTRTLTSIILIMMLYVPTASSQDATQSGVLSILPGSDISIVNTPDSFSFPIGFIPHDQLEINNLYKTLDPQSPSEILKVIDTNAGGGFDVTLSTTDFTSAGDDIIHYTDIAIVTLSANPNVNSIDGLAGNTPPGAPNAIAPIDCPWDPIGYQNPPNAETMCNGYMLNFTEPPSSFTTLTTPANPSDTTIDVTDASSFTNPPPGFTHQIRINNDIIDYTSIIGNTFSGVTGIDTTHNPPDEVRQYSSTSEQILIMENTSASDSGTYSIGFGFRFTYNGESIASNYGTTLTYTLIPL